MRRSPILRHVKELSWSKPKPSASNRAATAAKYKTSPPASASKNLGLLAPSSTLTSILTHFPKSSTSLAFGYGSGVFQQSSSSTSSTPTQPPPPTPMIDIILSTPNSQNFHEENMQKNAYHYSSLPLLLGSKTTTKIQRDYGAAIYFNPLVPITTENGESVVIKYGVIEDSDLILDLKEWSSLYVAGRMHKPIAYIIDPASSKSKQNDEMADAVQVNLLAGLAGGLLTLDGNADSKMSYSKLFNSISQLSYTGDPRMSTGAEDPKKVEKLVSSQGQLERYMNIYQPAFSILESNGLIGLNEDGVTFENASTNARIDTLKYLPLRLNSNKKNVDAKMLKVEIAGIVSKSARSQSAKGVVTAGVGKSVEYLIAKFRKGGVL